MTDKTKEKKQRLLSLLREMFQLDQPDLDFGLYRIMHAKRGQVEAFLETEFDQLIDKVFAGRGARQEDEARKVYEAAKQQAIDFGAPDPDAAPMVQQARARYDVIRLTGGEDAEIYDHLYRFFSRYYDAGDFLSLRRYGKGAAGGAETYAIPYDGAEVVLHWANKDQYYIKTTENFSHFSFNPRQALEKDERGVTRQLFDDADTAAPLQVHFRLVDAAEGAHNNVKAGDKDERFFLLDAATPIAWEGAELVIRLHYQPDPDKSGQKGKWQDKRNEQTVQTVLTALANETHPQAPEYRAVLAREVPKGKDKKQALLARYLTRYTASNSMDYFIHKDLGGFLRRELDFYLKNEVLKLDDFVGGEDADVQAGISEARLKALQSALEKAQAIRLLSQRLIDFLAQLENFQKKLWLKKKFVVETQYCITLDRIPEKYYPEIAANERQREEWVKLFAIDEIKEDAATVGYTVPLTVEFLKEHSFLMLDTAIFSDGFKQTIIESIEAFDDKHDGVIFHSDNFQALGFLDNTYRASIDCIYIDPPYNTDASAIIYKNGYKDSSWLSLMRNRLELASTLMRDEALLTAAVDDEEVATLRILLNDIFEKEVGISVVRSNPQSRKASGKFSPTHEYALFYGKTSKAFPYPIGYEESKAARYPYSDEQGRYAWMTFIRAGSGDRREDRPTLYYPIAVSKDNKIRVINMEWDGSRQEYILLESVGDDEELVYPIKIEDGKPIEKRWQRGHKRLADEYDEYRVRRNDNGISIDFKTRMDEEAMPTTWWDKGEYASANYGASELKDLFSEKNFDFPKAKKLVEDAIRACGAFRHKAVVLDFFGGSGTTADAVISLCRETNGKQKYILVEQGDYFYSVIKPRIQKVVYSVDWKLGKPISRKGLSHAFRYVRLESYEDCLNNLSLNPKSEAVAQVGDAELQRDYLLRYMLDVETQGSQSLLNIAQFSDPTAYQLEIKKPGSDERVKRPVDLVETFNWLIGLHVEKLHAGRYFTATFVRKPDPLLPEDGHTRLQVNTLSELPVGRGEFIRPTPLEEANKFAPTAGEGLKTWWFRPVEGYVRTVPGDDRHRQSVLVLWRSLTDDPEQDAAVLEAFLTRQMKFDPNRREDKTLYDVIYINGTHNLPKLGKYGEVRLLEEEFHRRMWAGEEV
jgi:adenine-specific DNA-methyltransferase